MNKQDYLNIILAMFKRHIYAHNNDFREYDYYNRKCETWLKNFMNNLKNEGGLSISEPYHANNIGNNNEYRIFLKEKDNDGFVIEKNVAKLHVTYGVYGGVSAWAEDYDTDEKICGVYHAR